MFIHQLITASLCISSALGFLSHFDTSDHLYAHHAKYAELDAHRAYKEIDSHDAYSNANLNRPVHQLHARWVDVLPNSVTNRISVRALGGNSGVRKRPTTPRVNADGRGISVTAGTPQALGRRPSGTSRPGSPRGRGSSSPRGRGGSGAHVRAGSMPRTGSPPNFGAARVEHAADEGLQDASHAGRASNEITGILRKADGAMEKSSNVDVKIGGEALAAAAGGVAVMGRVLNGAKGSGEESRVVKGVASGVERLENELHIGHHHEHADQAGPSVNGNAAPVGGPSRAGSGSPNRAASGSRRNRAGSKPASVAKSKGAASNQPPPESAPQYYEEESDSDSSHSSDETNSGWEQHQHGAAGQFVGEGNRPRPGMQGGGGGGPGDHHPAQSIVGRPTRQGIPARPRRPPKPKKVPKKAKSTKPWNALGIGVTAVGVVIAGGASVAGTIAQEKGAEAAVKGADASQLSAQAGMKGANAAQLSAEAGIESAHASTIIAEANIKISNGSKEGADGTQLIAATNYQTAKSQGVNVTAASQMAQQASRTNSKRKRSYPPVVLYYDW